MNDKLLRDLCSQPNADRIYNFLLSIKLTCEELDYKEGALLIHAIKNISQDSLEAVKMLHQAGANIHVDHDAPLRCAIMHNKDDVVKYFMQQQESFQIDSPSIHKYLQNKPTNELWVEKLKQSTISINTILF